MAEERVASPPTGMPDDAVATEDSHVEVAPVERTQAPAGPAGRRMRARLARMATKSQSGNPVLEPLYRAVRANHPKADLELLERAYLTAERLHASQTRKSGDPYITHPLAVTTILAELGMDPATLMMPPMSSGCAGSNRKPTRLARSIIPTC